MKLIERLTRRKTEQVLDDSINAATMGVVVTGLVTTVSAGTALIAESKSWAVMAGFTSSIFHTVAVVDVTLIAGRVLLHVWKVEKEQKQQVRVAWDEAGLDEVVEEIQARPNGGVPF